MTSEPKEISPRGGSVSRAPGHASRWAPRRPGQVPKFPQEISSPPPSGSATPRDDLSRAVALHLAGIATRRLAAAAVVVAAYWWHPWLAVVLVGLWLLYRAVSSGRLHRPVSKAVARRWSR